jgi:hypothetical protein
VSVVAQALFSRAKRERATTEIARLNEQFLSRAPMPRIEIAHVAAIQPFTCLPW